MLLVAGDNDRADEKVTYISKNISQDGWDETLTDPCVPRGEVLFSHTPSNVTKGAILMQLS